jgi:formylglycine-generating enzyme required for sulfatase activity
MLRIVAGLILSLGIGSSAAAVSMDWTSVGNPGNACDTQQFGCFGSVGYAYQIGTYEVTNAQYAEFLNAKAAADPLGLYNGGMGSGVGGITRSGVSGSYTYSAIAGRGDMAVNAVSFYDALRFANWLENGQPTGAQDNTTTEDGTYTFSDATTVGSRNAGAAIVIPSGNEWYKAAYYDAASTSYLDYPAGSDTQTTCAFPTATANRANCNNAVGDLTDVGSYTGSASPYGTFDQGGNVFEWNEAIISGTFRGMRGGSHLLGPGNLAASARAVRSPSDSTVILGFRVAMIPEPGTGLLVIAGLLGLAGWRRASA